MLQLSPHSARSVDVDIVKLILKDMASPWKAPCSAQLLQMAQCAPRYPGFSGKSAWPSPNSWESRTLNGIREDVSGDQQEPLRSKAKKVETASNTRLTRRAPPNRSVIRKSRRSEEIPGKKGAMKVIRRGPGLGARQLQSRLNTLN